MRAHWEKRTQLTSVISAEQLDDDRVLIYRRVDHVEAIVPSTYERIILNRQNLTAESTVIAPNPDRTETVVEQTTFHADTPVKNSTSTHMDTFAYECQGSLNGRVDIFKTHVQRIIQAMKFKEWSEEQTDK